MTWTEDNGGGCADSDDVIVQFSNLSYVDAVVQSTCGSADGEITLTASDGVIAYQYSIDNGANFQASGNFTGLLAGNYNVVVQDAIGCQCDWNSFSNGSRRASNKWCYRYMLRCVMVDVMDLYQLMQLDATQFSVDGGATFQGVNAFHKLMRRKLRYNG